MSLDAERALIGCVLFRPDSFDAVDVPADDFSMLPWRTIWQAFADMRAAGEPIDPVTVHDRLERAGIKAITLGGLSDLVSATATSDNVGYYAKLVSEAALTRRVRNLGQLVGSSHLEGEELLSWLLEQAGALGDRKADEAVLMGDAVLGAFQELHRQSEAKAQGGGWGVKTGFSTLDYMLGGGLQRGVVTILGGRPSHGKSSLARSIADHVSQQRLGVHVFTLEDTRTPYALRALADHGQVDLQKLRSLEGLNQSDMGKLNAAGDRLFGRRNWMLDDSAGLSAGQVALRVRRHKRALNTAVVVVDYVQLMREPGAKDKRAEIDRAAEGLVRLARSENVAVLLLSQLNRESEKRAEGEPILSDLRESGVLEQIADAVVFVYRGDEAPQKGEKYTGPRLLIRKNKHGRVGLVKLHWDAPCATYRSLRE